MAATQEATQGKRSFKAIDRFILALLILILAVGFIFCAVKLGETIFEIREDCHLKRNIVHTSNKTKVQFNASQCGFIGKLCAKYYLACPLLSAQVVFIALAGCCVSVALACGIYKDFTVKEFDKKLNTREWILMKLLGLLWIPLGIMLVFLFFQVVGMVVFILYQLFWPGWTKFFIIAPSFLAAAVVVALIVRLSCSFYRRQASKIPDETRDQNNCAITLDDGPTLNAPENVVIKPEPHSVDTVATSLGMID